MARRKRRRRRAFRRIALIVALAAVSALLIRYHDLILNLWLPCKPPGIILHHSASPPGVGSHIIDAAALDRMHAHRGFITWYKGKAYHIGYHFVILQDGTVQQGRPVGCRGAHTHGPGDLNSCVGICLVGDFCSRTNRNGAQGPTRPTSAQQAALVRLCGRLMDTYDIPASNVKRHCDFNRTECPGDRFPYRWLIRELSQGRQRTR